MSDDAQTGVLYHFSGATDVLVLYLATHRQAQTMDVPLPTPDCGENVV